MQDDCCYGRKARLSEASISAQKGYGLSCCEMGKSLIATEVCQKISRGDHMSAKGTLRISGCSVLHIYD